MLNKTKKALAVGIAVAGKDSGTVTFLLKSKTATYAQPL